MAERASRPADPLRRITPSVPAPGRPAVEWQDLASCRGLDTNLFFPLSSAGAGWGDISQVKKLCHNCPVRQACLRWADVVGVTDGIWGGLTPTERRTRRSVETAGPPPRA